MVEERVLAGDLALAHPLLAHQSTDARPGEVDLVERRAWEGTARLVLEVPHVLLGCGDLAGISGVVGVGRADDRRIEPRHDEEQSPVALREKDMRVLHRMSADDVDALGQAEEWVGPLPDGRDRPVEPGSGSDDRETSADLDVAAPDRVAHPSTDDAVVLAKKVGDPRMVQDEGSVRGRIDQVLDHEPLDERDLRVIEPPCPYQSVGLERRLRGKRRGAVKVLPLRQALVEREQVVELHAQSELQLIEEGRPVERQEEREGKHEVRRDTQEDLALAHVAAHQREVEELEVAEPAVDQPRRPGCGAGAEVRLFDEGNLEPAKGGVARDARPDDPAADDKKIDGAAAERPHRLISCGYLFALLYLSIASFTSAAAASRACCEVA